MTQPTIKDNNNSFNYTNTVNVWNHYAATDGRSQLLAWLSPLEPRLRHRDLQERRVDDVGGWLMQTEEFGRWQGGCREVGGDKPVFFYYGDPGVGKTFISSLVVDRLCDRARGQNTAVTCFYFDFAARKEQSVTSMLGSLLKQVVSGIERVPEGISRAFQEQKKVIGGRAPQLSDIVKMLEIITHSQRTFMCIDAIDECAAVHRIKLLDALKQILKKSPDTRIFVTGRPHILGEIEKRLAGRAVSVSVGPRKGDIIRYLRIRLDEDETPEAMDESLAADILQKIPENISEMFILVSLNIGAILQESTIYRRRQRLSKMIDGLGLEDAYGATIDRIKAQGGDKARLGMGALMWISHSERPLRADELCHALAVEIGSTDFSAENAPAISTLVVCCQGLITVDKEASTVRLIHYTLQEYLSAHSDVFKGPHSAMAEICLTYLNSPQVKVLSANPPPRAQETPFLEYCSVYWGVHAKRELSDNGRSLALELSHEHYSPISTRFLLAQVKYLYLWRHDTFSPFSGLHCASFFGIVEIVAALIEMDGYDINGGDFLGYTPLSWAARRGQEEVVKILLGREEVNPDKLDNYGRTPLSFAAEYGWEGVVKLLLGRQEVNPDRANNDGRTPLSWAALNGHEGVVEVLLRRGEVCPDNPDNGGRTPLLYAAWYGHEGVVGIILGRKEVNPDKPDNYGRTPLSYAAWFGQERMVKVLLGREEVNPDKPDNGGRTQLSYASSNGHEGVVKMLLRRKEVNPNEPNDDGRTSLSWGALNGHEGVVRILLRQGEVDPDKLDDKGRTPLSYAAWYGHEGVVGILLGREEVDSDKQDDSGRTPLSYAAWYGYEGVVEMLLAQQEVNPEKPNNSGQTPLSFATLNGHGGVVNILLRRKEVNPDRGDNYGRTPLSYAARFGHEGVAKILLGREEVNPDRRDNNGRTPLSFAISYEQEGVIALLRSAQAVTADAI